MRELSGEAWAAEIARLGAIALQAWAFDMSGIELHAPGDAITSAQARLLRELAIPSVFLTEPREKPDETATALGAERVAGADLRESDFLAREVRGRTSFPAGTRTEGTALEAMRSLPGGTFLVASRARLLEAARAAEYLARGGRSPARLFRPDPAQDAASAPVHWPAVPRAEVLVALQDDAARLRLVNALLAAGHGAREQRGWSLPEGAKGKIDVVIVGLADAARAAAEVRRDPMLQFCAILAVGEDARGAAAFKALQSGANEVLSLPVRPDALLEKVRSCGGLQGKRLRWAPFVLSERRAGPRERKPTTCRLRDPFLTKPLPISTATVLDIGDGGIRIEYGLLEGIDLRHYQPNAVHPSHFFYGYARLNPLGRDLEAAIVRPGLPDLVSPARVVHVSRAFNAEVAGLVFIKKQPGISTRIRPAIDRS
jgi:CheY-like chemotaxis protein